MKSETRLRVLLAALIITTTLMLFSQAFLIPMRPMLQISLSLATLGMFTITMVVVILLLKKKDEPLRFINSEYPFDAQSAMRFIVDYPENSPWGPLITRKAKDACSSKKFIREFCALAFTKDDSVPLTESDRVFNVVLSARGEAKKSLLYNLGLLEETPLKLFGLGEKELLFEYIETYFSTFEPALYEPRMTYSGDLMFKMNSVLEKLDRDELEDFLLSDVAKAGRTDGDNVHWNGFWEGFWKEVRDKHLAKKVFDHRQN